MGKISILFFSILCFSHSAFSYDEEFWANLEKREDVKITINNGVKTAHFSGGVDVSDNGLSIDNSGKGAVLCAREIYIGLRDMMSVCSSEKDSQLKKDLDFAVEKINDFVVMNSLTPITKAEIDEDTNNKFLKIKKWVEESSKPEIEKECASGFYAGFAKSMSSISSEDFRKKINESLSIRRPAVMNPCL